MFVLANVLSAAAVVLDKTLSVYSLVIIVAVLVKWVSPDPFNPIVQLLTALTEPAFEWIRRRMPFVVIRRADRELDLSPIAVLLLIGFVQLAVVKSLFDLSVRLQ